MPQQRTGEAQGFSSSKLSVLRKHPYFADLEPEAFDQLCRYAKHSTLKRGATIFSKGDPGISLFAVISGTVKISISSPDGRNAILNLIGAGEIFGEIALLDRQPRSADAIANTNCELFIIDRREFIPFVQSQPTLAMKPRMPRTLVATPPRKAKSFTASSASYSAKSSPKMTWSSPPP